MSPLRNTRQEAFAQLLAKGSSKSAAYVGSGYKPDRHHAARLATKGPVAQRVAELQQRAQEQTQVTIGSLVAAADELRELAIEHKRISAGVAAVREIGILTGLRIDRREIGAAGEFDRLSDQELMRLIEGEVELLPLPDDAR